jgi:hypothetical protein
VEAEIHWALLEAARCVLLLRRDPSRAGPPPGSWLDRDQLSSRVDQTSAPLQLGAPLHRGLLGSSYQAHAPLALPNPRLVVPRTGVGSLASGNKRACECPNDPCTAATK